MIRDEFEKLFPVPLGVVFADDTYVPENPFLEAEEWATMRRLSEKQQHLWQGFQAGHAAGLEDAIEICLENGDHNTADAIRMMLPERNK